MDRYEKALELARAYYDKDANVFLDTIFPELKESRDEQIRKAIGSVQEHFADVSKTIENQSLDMPFPEDNLPGTDITYEEAVAWLEKQKDREWSEEDEKMTDNIVSVLSQYIDYKSVSGTGSGYATPRYSKEIDWLNSLRPQQKVEWSEEDEKNLELVIDCIYTFYPDPVMKYKLKDWLKSLRPQPKWKPNEEQMKALNALNLYGGLSYVGQESQLISLYQDLKKLM